MFYVNREFFGVRYQVAIFPHPSVAGYFSYHSSINGEPVPNTVYKDIGSSIGAYGRAKDAFEWGCFHTEDQIIESQLDTID